MNDIWQTRDPAVIVGCQLRAGKTQQRNPQPGTIHRVPGWKARLSRFLAKHLGDRK